MSRAPYRPGDRVRVLHDCAIHGTEARVVRVTDVVPLTPGGWGARWRLRGTRCDGTPLEVTVDATGNDEHGYVGRPT